MDDSGSIAEPGRKAEGVGIIEDSYGRTVDYMRVSITDRCNLRCRYCMPKSILPLASGEILTLEEIVLICRAAAEIGIRKFKITGGEPLVRPGCPQLVGMLKRIPGVEQVTLTTNGILLGRYLDELYWNGLDAVNISLDTLNPGVYKKITGFDELFTVRENIRRTVKKGLRVKINSVLLKGINDGEWERLVELAKEETLDVRFIEMMPIGCGKYFEPTLGEEVLAKIRGKYPEIKRDNSVHGNGPALYYKIPDFKGSIGFINAVHGKFCGSCNRMRLTAEGELKPCLCYESGINVKEVLRKRKTREASSVHKKAGESEIRMIEEAIREAVRRKPQMHCFEIGEQVSEDRQMNQIGG